MPGNEPRLTIAAASILHADGSLAPGRLTLRGTRIDAVSRAGDRDDADVVLAEGILAPGFVDLQFNGADGVDLGQADADGWRRVLSRVTSTGVTSLLATFVSAVPARLREAADVARQVMTTQQDDEAAVLGVHAEGPFLAPGWRGAHDPGIVRAATASGLAEFVEYADGLVRMVTLAPERDGAAACIRALARREVVVSAGHTGATAAELAAAADLGVRAVTHLYNAQTGLHHRELGVVGQTLLDDRLTATVIADPDHLAPGALRLAFAAKPGRIALVTDSVAAAGLPPGRHQMPDGEVVVTAGAPPRRPDGRLAGSALRMDQAVRNAVQAGIALPAALRAASTVPADLVGHRELGRLEPGCVADMVWLDSSLRVREVWRSGRRIHPPTTAPPPCAGPHSSAIPQLEGQ